MTQVYASVFETAPPERARSQNMTPNSGRARRRRRERQWVHAGDEVPMHWRRPAPVRVSPGFGEGQGRWAEGPAALHSAGRRAARRRSACRLVASDRAEAVARGDLELALPAAETGEPDEAGARPSSVSQRPGRAPAGGLPAACPAAPTDVTSKKPRRNAGGVLAAPAMPPASRSSRERGSGRVAPPDRRRWKLHADWKL